MLINDLLFTVRVQHHHKGVIPRDNAAHLKTVHQKHGDIQPVLSCPQEE